MSEKLQSYLIYVTIIEGRHFTLLNMDSIVHIRIGTQRKSTGVRKSTDCPYFNEYFVFEFNTTLSKLLDQYLVLTVIQPSKCWRRRKIIGNFKLDVATIWTAHERQYYHKWVPINAGLQDKKPGVKGYLKIDVGVLTKGEVPRFPVMADNSDDEIEGNLLLPDSMLHDRFRANYIFVIYHADEIPKIKSSSMSCKKIIDCPEQSPNTYVQITFAGLTGKTNVRKNTQNPVWNEKIILTELFPSLCQRIKIELRYTQHVTPVVHYICLKSICNDGENGFLPTFGPSYIYLYGSEYSGTKYNGKLLFEMRTEILTDLMWSANAVEVQQLRQIPNLRLWPIEQILLFCNIYSVNMMDKKLKDKQITFEISMGRTSTDSTDFEFVSSPIKPILDNKKIYSYLPLQDKVMTLFMFYKLEDLRTRIYNMNMMKKIYHLLKVDLEQVEELFEEGYKKNKEKITSAYLQISEKLENNCRIYLKIVKSAIPSKVELDKKKLELCIKEIQDIEANISSVVHQENRKGIFRKLLNYLCIIHSLIDDVQYCWPDIIIWMLSGNNRIGYYRLPVKDIIFSTKSEEKGLFCGSFQNFYLKHMNKSKLKLSVRDNTSESSIICRMRAQLWLGLHKEQDKCLSIVPNCFKPAEILEKYEMPKTYKCTETRLATCKVYLYQGRFEPGADHSGLSDPYVQVIFNEHVLQTKAVPKTIHPLWNETLIFKNIVLYGSLEFIASHVPKLVLEAYDQDAFHQNEFIGRCDLIPEISSNEKQLNLRWIKFFDGDRCPGEILTAAEINLFQSTGDADSSPVYATIDTIPEKIKPEIKSYRLDVYFWGVHDLKPLCLVPVSRPKITVEVGGTTLHSTTLQNTKRYLNFNKPYQSVFVTIPDEEEYFPPLSINMFDCRGFGWYVYVGTHLGRLQDFTFKPLSSTERVKLLDAEYHNKSVTSSSTDDSISILQTKECTVDNDFKARGSIEFDLKKFKIANQYLYRKLKKQLMRKQQQENITSLMVSDKMDIIEIDSMDWWTKFYISTEHAEIYKYDPLKEKLKITVYPCELESIEEFASFNDLLHTFNLYRGKRTGDEILDSENTVAIFKGAIRIYQWPPDEDDMKEYVTETGYPMNKGSFQHYPVNEPVSYLARVYVVRAFHLRPKDLSGKSDPYLIVKLGDREINDKENYVPDEVNPVFGRCFEIKGVFPNDNLLTISVWDYDLTSADDLIGETRIDLENRLYTNHRANCGLPIMYIEQGPSAWRDQYKPSQILKILCKRNNLDDPEFHETAVKIGHKIFKDTEPEHANKEIQKEILSLLVLNRWREIPLVGCSLVPEHVETRSLYHYSKPGLEQGKLQIWVDVFPSGDYPPPPAVDIKPRAPIPYELRIIVWNTEEVILDEDDFFIGEKKSDIYVKGWLTNPEGAQCTDVHYNSISGEGNFNWRLVFNFLYLSAEDKIVVKKKGSIFSEGVESKLPCFLNLQVWDNDNFNPDDFLGSLRLSLTHLPRGAKTSKLCSLNILKRGAPTINLFKTKRHKGWWPFLGKEDEKHKTILAGKVELEFQLLTEDEYKSSPAGLGRSDPQGLPVPKRPDVSFSWFMNPLKALKFLVCKRFRTHFIVVFLLGILFFIGFVAIYSFPNYLVKRILGA